MLLIGLLGIISWKVKWLCEYPVIGHWKLPMNGPTAHFWSFLSQALWHIFPFVHPCWICSEAYLLLWPAWPAMTHSPSCLASGPGNCQPFRHDWQEWKAKSVGKNMKSSPNSHSLVMSRWSHIFWALCGKSHMILRQRGLFKTVVFLNRHIDLADDASSWSALKDKLKFHFLNSDCISGLQRRAIPFWPWRHNQSHFICRSL